LMARWNARENRQRLCSVMLSAFRAGFLDISKRTSRASFATPGLVAEVSVLRVNSRPWPKRKL